jgi:hypothetical protein
MLQIPTDNLYKFLAISGIVITFFSLWLFYNQVLTIRNSSVEIDKFEQLLENRESELQCQNDVLEIWSKELKNVNLLDDTDKKAFFEDYESEVHKYKKILEQYEKVIIELGSLEEYQSIRFDLFNLYKLFSPFGFTIGMLFMIFGFKHWDIEIKKVKKRNKKK